MVVGSIFRLLYEAILKENASNENANEEEKNDDDDNGVGNPFLRCASTLSFWHGLFFFIFFFFLYTLQPLFFRARGGEVKEKKINTAAATPSERRTRAAQGIFSSFFQVGAHGGNKKKNIKNGLNPRASF